MKAISRWLSVFLLTLTVMFTSFASADAVSDLVNSLGLQNLFSEVGTTVGTVGASVLDPVGTGDNDFLGADVLNPENDLGATVMSGELTGFGNKTGSGTMMPLDDLGLSQLLNTLGLTYEAGFATQLRSLIGPDGVVILGVEGLLDGVVGGIPGQDSGIALDGAENGLIGLTVLNSSSGGNGGAIGVAVLSGDNSGNGESVGVTVLGGSGSGNGDSVGAAVLSGDNSGNSEFTGATVLGGSNSGNGGTAGATVLSGNNSGNGGVAGAAVLSGANSGNGGVVGAGVLSGPGSGNGGLITVLALNEPGDQNTGTGGNDGSCAGSGGVGCNGPLQLAMLDTCQDSDGDGVCDDRDECLNTPANTPVFLTGCHLTEDAPLVLRGVNFEFDKSDLTAESYPILEHAVRVLAAQPEALVAVDGHTDWMGSDDYNIRLSYRRANTVYRYLVDAGIDEKRLAFRGFGEGVPVAPNANDDGSDNPAGRAENRRVELNILDGGTFQSVKEENLAN